MNDMESMRNEKDDAHYNEMVGMLGIVRQVRKSGGGMFFNR